MTLCSLLRLILPYILLVLGGLFTVSGVLLTFLNQIPRIPLYANKIPGPLLLLLGIIIVLIGASLLFRQRMRKLKYSPSKTRKKLINAAATESKKKHSCKRKAKKRKMPATSIGGRPVDKPPEDVDLESSLAGRIKQRRLDTEDIANNCDNLPHSETITWTDPCLVLLKTRVILCGLKWSYSYACVCIPHNGWPWCPWNSAL